MVAKVSATNLAELKAQHTPIAGLTAYDYPTGMLVDRAGLDFILVGDSLGPLILGYSRVEQTTMDDMVHHCAAVSRAASRALVIGDLPFGTYEFSPAHAVENAILLVQRGNVGAVKLEGGLEVVEAVRAVASAHIPVIGHLAPLHSGHSGAGGTSTDARVRTLVASAQALEEAGAAALVVVGLPAEHARAITEALRRIPTIGYQSGPHCDGQLLVWPSMLGLLPGSAPVAGPYGTVGHDMADAFVRFAQDVRERRFQGDFTDTAASASHR